MSDEIISNWCRTDAHGWCANRSFEECHCQCECHDPTSVKSKYLTFKNNPIVGKVKSMRDVQECIARLAAERRR